MPTGYTLTVDIRPALVLGFEQRIRYQESCRAHPSWLGVVQHSSYLPTPQLRSRRDVPHPTGVLVSSVPRFRDGSVVSPQEHSGCFRLPVRYPRVCVGNG